MRLAMGGSRQGRFHPFILGVMAFLLLQKPPVTDAAIDMLPNGITTVGKTFRVVCTVIGESFVGWEDVNGQRVTKVPLPDELPEEKYYRLIQGNSHTLVVQNVAVADGGNYTCRGDKTVKSLLYTSNFSSHSFPRIKVSSLERQESFNVPPTAILNQLSNGTKREG